MWKWLVIRMADIALDIQIAVDRTAKGIQIDVESNRKDLELSVSKGGGVYYPDYTGDYEVVSDLYDDQTLETKNRRMTDNVTVKPIPIHTVQNPSGGYTVTIGQ